VDIFFFSQFNYFNRKGFAKLEKFVKLKATNFFWKEVREREAVLMSMQPKIAAWTWKCFGDSIPKFCINLFCIKSDVWWVWLFLWKNS